MQRLITSAAVLTLGLFGAAAHAATMNVDFNGKLGPTESGYLAFDVPEGEQSDSETFTNPFGTGDDVTVTYNNNSSHGSNNQDKSSSSFSPVDLLRDFAGPRHMNTFDLDLDGLPAGPYRFTGYHHTESTTGANEPIDVAVSVDGSSAGSFTTSNPNSASASTFSFTFSVSGDPTPTVNIDYEKTGGTGDFFPHNGFDLTVIPEPASAALLGLGGLALLRRRRA